MTYFGAFVVFLVVWWLVLFCVLPFGVNEKTTQEGHASSAPAKPNLRKKMLITTIIAIFITSIFYVLKYYGFLKFF